MKANPKKFQFKILGKTSRQPTMLNININQGRRISKSSSPVSHI